MPIPDPWAEQNQPAEPAEPAPNGAPEREPERERARVYPERETETGHGEVLPFPGHTTGITESDHQNWVTGLKSAATSWASEAQETTRAALDGSVWRSRPPALRDMHARLVRAEWAGGVRWLYVPGLAFGYVSLAVTALGYALLWITRRPSRLAVAVLIAVLIVFFAF